MCQPYPAIMYSHILRGEKKSGYISVLPSTGTEVSEFNSLLGWYVDHNEPIDASCLAILKHTFIPILKNRIVIAHQQKRGLETLPPSSTSHVEDCRDCNSIFEGLGIGPLNGRSISDGICERDSKLNYICEGLLKLVNRGFRRVGGNEGGTKEYGGTITYQHHHFPDRVGYPLYPQVSESLQ